MKIIIAAGLLAFAISTAAVASPTSAISTITTATPGYDRPAPTNHQSDGHQHVVYWSDFFDGFDFDPQTAADARNLGELTMKAKAPKQGK